MRTTLDIKTRRLLGDIIGDNLDYLVRFATIRIGSRVEAEDVVHEAVKRLLEADLSRIKRDSLRMYLFRIVYNLCKDHLITGGHQRHITAADYEIPDTTADEALDAEEITRLNSILATLPQREAEVITMNVIDGLSFVEISQLLSTPASTVKSRFKSGMDKLRSLYLKNR